MLLMAGARAQDKLLKKESAGGVQQTTQLLAICTIIMPGTQNHISSNKGQRRRNLPATHASRANWMAKEGRWVGLMRVAQARDSCGQMTFPVPTPAISGARTFRGSSQHFRPTPPRRRSGDQALACTLFPLNPFALLHSPRPPRFLTRESMLPRLGVARQAWYLDSQ